MVGPADYVLRAGRVGVLKREHQRRLSALTRLARSIGAAQHGHGSYIRPVVGRKLACNRHPNTAPRACAYPRVESVRRSGVRCRTGALGAAVRVQSGEV